MYKLRNIARRSTMVLSSGALLFASFASGTSAFADALNPLTHRSLTLSSSSPGWDSSDGSGNATYAPPNSGANGKKTGNTFSFNVSTDSSSTNLVKGFSFQYCTTSAGECLSPGNNGWSGSGSSHTRNGDDAAARKSDFNVVTDGNQRELTSPEFGTHFTSGNVTSVPAADGSAGNFSVLYKDAGSNTWAPSIGWSMTTTNVETGSLGDGTATGNQNYIKLANTGGGLNLHSGGAVKIVFFGTTANYITNPGQGAFFVKINDYNSATTFSDSTLVDGGVTVANVMNQSIQITTKVLETMEFSVGTVDPNTLSSSNGTTSAQSDLQKAMGIAATSTANATKHGTCDRILRGINAADVQSQNVLQMGDAAAENSLSTAHTYSTHSYWRLSSNSSAGATVYYAGVTLSNTVGDQIDPINAATNPGVKTAPVLGTKQFGLALANGTRAANNPVADLSAGTNITHVFPINYAVERDSGDSTRNYENGADNTTNGVHSTVATDVGSNASWHTPRLYPLVPAVNYDQGAGTVNDNYTANSPVDTAFAFDPNSNQIPTEIASESNSVVDCVTGKMRYIANISATTPAGIYTTKINYIAAPQY